MKRLSRPAAAAAIAALAGAIGCTPGAHAQGMFPAAPDPFAPKLVAAEDAPLARITPVTDAMLLNHRPRTG